MALERGGLPVYPLPAAPPDDFADQLMGEMRTQAMELHSFTNGLIAQTGAEGEHQAANLRKVTTRLERQLEAARRAQRRDLEQPIAQALSVLESEINQQTADVTTIGTLAKVAVQPVPDLPAPAPPPVPIYPPPAAESGWYGPGWYCIQAPPIPGSDWQPNEVRAALLQEGSWLIRLTAGWRILAGPFPDMETAEAAGCALPAPPPAPPSPFPPPPPPPEVTGCCPVTVNVAPTPVYLTCPPPTVQVQVSPGAAERGGMEASQPPRPFPRPFPPEPEPEPAPPAPAPWPTEPPGTAADEWVPDTRPVDWQLAAVLLAVGGAFAFLRL